MPQTFDSVHPSWATDEARASLTIGLTVPVIEQRLVAKGLTPVEASAVVTEVLRSPIAAQFKSVQQAERNQTVHRVAAVLVLCLCVILGYAFGAVFSAGRAFLVAALPTAAICFPTPFAAHWGDNSPALVRLGGWLALLAVLGWRVLLLSIKP